MGSSVKRKKEKAKDFQKPKLKVGKARPKASNTTNTSFQAKSIVLKQQSLSTDLPSTANQFGHHLSLLSSKTDSQRRDALSGLLNVLANTESSALPQPAVTIIVKVRPLLIDASKTVRSSALEVLKSLPVADIVRNVEAIQIYMHIGLTHMVPDIRISTLDVLEWLLHTLGSSAVSCAGGWVGTLKRLLGTLGWQSSNAPSPGATKSWTSVSNAKLQDTKSTARQIGLLSLLLEVGLSPRGYNGDVFARGVESFPLVDPDAYAIGRTADPYRSLDLFSDTEVKEDDGVATLDPLSRELMLKERFLPSILQGAAKCKKEGGEIGRETRKVELVLAARLNTL
ncbi:Pre-rRNA-processing protein ipi1-like protein [Elsinoe fawcettii]|nr:Pre-rRNA-processing protein ipi1-like protein [Elsinoe fawcettii]